MEKDNRPRSNCEQLIAKLLSAFLSASLFAAVGCNSISKERLRPLIPVRTPPTQSASAHPQSVARVPIVASSDSSSRPAFEAPVIFACSQEATLHTDANIALVNYEENERVDLGANTFKLASCMANGACSPNSGCAFCGQSCGADSGCLSATGTGFIDDQEYLFDGGDHDPRVIVQDDWSVKGLQPEDTVMHYETIDGKLCVVATNRVPIYAPRFAAVRKISGPNTSESSVGAERILVPVGPVAVRETDLVGTVALPIGPKGEESVKLIDAFRDRNRGVPAESVVPPLPMSDAIAPLVNLNFFRTGRIEDAEIAVLGRILANARMWSTPESLAVMIDGKTAVQVKDSKGAQEVLIYEMPPGKCSMRICKASSHSMASPGDIIHFTIRFDNVGVLPVGNAVILDSLSTRLEYVDGSQQSSLKTKFSTEENEAGSSVLRWEIDSPLKTGEGGTIHFRCRIR